MRLTRLQSAGLAIEAARRIYRDMRTRQLVFGNTVTYTLRVHVFEDDGRNKGLPTHTLDMQTETR